MVALEYIAYGVGHGDEGICLLVKMGPYRILLDCGLGDVSALEATGAQASHPHALPADLLLCTHAHPDHARGLLALHKAFPGLPIYASEATLQLLHLNWPSLSSEDVSTFCQALPWRSPIEFGDGLSAELLPVGHLPGAAAFLLTYTPQDIAVERTYTLLYTGDFFLSNSRLVEGLPLAEFRELSPDVLIVEGTYGTTRHPHRRQQENQLAERMAQFLEQGLSLILPVSVLGLGQELLMLLRSHHLFTGKSIDIWVDPAIAAGCDAYLQILPHLPSAVQNFAQHQSLFWDERVRPRVRRLVDPAAVQSPCILLVEKNADLTQYWQHQAAPWLLLLPAHSPQVSPPFFTQTDSQTLPQEPAAVAAQYYKSAIAAGQLTIDTYLLAQHSDGPGTTQLIHNLRPQHVIFMHGSPTYLGDLIRLDELNNRYHLHSPAPGVTVELPIGDGLLQTAPEIEPAIRYEGELNELGTVVTITLPDAIAADPRWQQFADTGLVEANWQGEALVLRGLNQRELLQAEVRAPMNQIRCCATCQFYRGQHCRNPESSLFSFKVTPEGYCPAFMARTAIDY